jgi:excinuclease ABC subunit C
MVSKADNIEYFLTSTEEEALILENRFIKKYNPPYNCLLK